MNKISAIVAAGAALVVAPAAMADTLKTDVKFGEYDGGSTDFITYSAEYVNEGKVFNTGLGVEVTPDNGDVTQNVKAFGSAGVDLQGPLGIKLAPSLQVGYAFNKDQPDTWCEPGKLPDGAFWGAKIEASRDLGPLTVLGSIRYRDGFENDIGIDNELQYEAGVDLNVTKHVAVGAAYVKTSADDAPDSEAIAAKLKIKI